MDALPIQEKTDLPFMSLNPGVMHACGHDMHTAIVLGVAIVLSEMRDKIKGNIKFIFQPAEEGPPPGEEGGAKLMIAQGVLENPEVGAIFGLHVWPERVGKVAYSPGPVMASSDRFSISIMGKSAHGARPNEGIDAIVIAAQVILGIQSIVSRLNDPTDPAVITIGKIEGGARANIIAERVYLEGTVRTLNEKNREQIEENIQRVVEGATKAFKADYNFRYRRGAPPLYNHPELGKTILPSLVRVVGEANVSAILPQMIAEDFSYYCQKIPGFYFMLGATDPKVQDPAPLHNPSFNPDERSIPIGIKILAHSLLDFLDHQQRIGKHFP
jgi:amidohydrolase